MGMTDKKLPKVYEGEVVPPRSDGTPVPIPPTNKSLSASDGLLTNVVAEVSDKVATRRVAAANALAEKINEQGQLLVDRERIKRDLAIEQGKNEDFTPYIEAARGEIQNVLRAQEADRADLARQQEATNAAAAKLRAGLEADQSEEENRQLAAELEKMRLLAALEEQRSKHDALKYNRAQLLQEIEKQIETLEAQKAEREAALNTFNGPAFDNDPTVAAKVKIISDDLHDIETTLAAAQQRAQSLR